MQLCSQRCIWDSSLYFCGVHLFYCFSFSNFKQFPVTTLVGVGCKVTLTKTLKIQIKLQAFFFSFFIELGGGQYLEWRNVERPIFRNFKITNIKITKDELFDSFITEFIFSLFINYLKNLIIFQVVKYWFSKL